MNTTIWLALIFLAFALGCLSIGVLRYTKDDKPPIERLQDADDDIEIRNLTDDELRQYHSIMNNGNLDAMEEERIRNL